MRKGVGGTLVMVAVAGAFFLHGPSDGDVPVQAPALTLASAAAAGTAVASTEEVPASLYRALRQSLRPGELASVTVPEVPDEALTQVVQRLCVTCHNDQLMTGNLSLQEFDVAEPWLRGETAEKMIVKLRLGMMPPPGIPQPQGDTMVALVETLESKLDGYAAERSDPGSRSFQRLNRPEYEQAIRDLLGLEVDAGAFLPLDTKSHNFDNIADVQLMSATLLDAYLRGASVVSRLAVGDPAATASEETYTVPRTASQTGRVEGGPFGSRGGISVVHTFPADGEYVFNASFYHETTGAFVGGAARGEQLEISVDGEPVAVLDVDRWMHSADPNGVAMRTDPIFVEAGPRRVSAVFVPTGFEGTRQDLVSPLGWSLASTSMANARGVTILPHLRDFVISGPHRVAGVSDTPVRQRIFTCRPERDEEARPCAREIVGRLATDAFRRDATSAEVDGLMGLYEIGAAEGGFEIGVRTALEGILASPFFVFRFERAPADLAPGVNAYRLSDQELATRLSFFLWSTVPDRELMEVARSGQLSQPDVMEAQVERMLRDPRAETLATRFAAQWLRLPDLAGMVPDVRQFPDFDDQLRASMRRETELFFHHLVQEDRPLFEFFDADYTFVDRRLARHYGIEAPSGPGFHRVAVTDPQRRGILGHASVLTLTSMAGRTSPVNRGLWIMEALLGTEPPPPPPVPPLDQTAAEDGESGRVLTVRERMEMHRANPTCNSCHQFIDPLGLALENMDPTGRWRLRDQGNALDSRGQLWDGTDVATPADLREALLRRPVPLVRTFTENLMTYALGRRLEFYDKPRIREITRMAEANDYRISSFIMGVVQSDAFQMARIGDTADDDRQQQR
jgi:hypothetical protein